MMRLFLAALALATLGLPRPAAAEDCLCIGPDAFSDAASDFAKGLVVVASDGSLESPDPLAPLLEIEAQAPRGSTPVLWCVSPDDPRCQRDDSGESPHQVTLSTAPIVLVSTPRVPRPGSIEVELVPDETRPRGGVRGRVDRPPRA